MGGTCAYLARLQAPGSMLDTRGLALFAVRRFHKRSERCFRSEPLDDFFKRVWRARTSKTGSGQDGLLVTLSAYLHPRGCARGQAPIPASATYHLQVRKLASPSFILESPMAMRFRNCGCTEITLQERRVWAGIVVGVISSSLTIAVPLQGQSRGQAESLPRPRTPARRHSSERMHWPPEFLSTTLKPPIWHPGYA